MVGLNLERMSVKTTCRGARGALFFEVISRGSLGD